MDGSCKRRLQLMQCAGGGWRLCVWGGGQAEPARKRCCGGGVARSGCGAVRVRGRVSVPYYRTSSTVCGMSCVVDRDVGTAEAWCQAPSQAGMWPHRQAAWHLLAPAHRGMGGRARRRAGCAVLAGALQPPCAHGEPYYCSARGQGRGVCGEIGPSICNPFMRGAGARPKPLPRTFGVARGPGRGSRPEWQSVPLSLLVTGGTITTINFHPMCVPHTGRAFRVRRMGANAMRAVRRPALQYPS